MRSFAKIATVGAFVCALACVLSCRKQVAPPSREEAEFYRTTLAFDSLAYELPALLTNSAVTDLEQLRTHYHGLYTNNPPLFKTGDKWSDRYELPQRSFTCLSHWSSNDPSSTPLIWSFFEKPKGVLYMTLAGSNEFAPGTNFQPLLSRVANRTTQLVPSPGMWDHLASSKITRTDGLEWLVGRWRCVTRQYFAKHEHLLAGRGEDSLDYFNVYLPYADDNLTLELTDDPERRPIAAEFLVRYIDDTGPFKEELAPMSPGGLVRIGRDRIWYGSPPANDFEFKYSVEKRGHRLWLILESKSTRLELIKLYAGLGDLRNSFVKAAIREYSAERVAELANQYENLKRVGRPVDSGERLYGAWVSKEIASSYERWKNVQECQFFVYEDKAIPVRDDTEPGEALRAELVVVLLGGRQEPAYDTQPVFATQDRLYLGPIGSCYRFRYELEPGMLTLSLLPNDQGYLKIRFTRLSTDPGEPRFPTSP